MVIVNHPQVVNHSMGLKGFGGSNPCSLTLAFSFQNSARRSCISFLNGSEEPNGMVEDVIREMAKFARSTGLALLLYSAFFARYAEKLRV